MPQNQIADINVANPDGSLSSYLVPYGGTTVSDPNGIYSTGLMGIGGIVPAPFWIFTFPTPGTFYYADAPHPFSTGSITVVPFDPNNPIPTPAETDAQRNAQYAGLLAPIAPDHQYGLDITQPFRIGPLGNGDNYLISVGWGTLAVNPFVGWHAFAPSRPTIYVGDSLTFTTGGFLSHIVAFNSSGEFGSIVAFPNGVPSLNPVYFFPNGPNLNYTGGYVGLGFFLSGRPRLGGGPVWAVNDGVVTFAAAGTYPFACGIHVGLGMIGEVTVLPRPPPAPLPPLPPQPQPSPQSVSPPPSGTTSMYHLLLANFLFVVLGSALL